MLSMVLTIACFCRGGVDVFCRRKGEDGLIKAISYNVAWVMPLYIILQTPGSG